MQYSFKILLHILAFTSAQTHTATAPQQCILTSPDPHDCDINYQQLDEYGRSTLHAAIFRGSENIVRSILNSTTNLNSDQHVRGSTLLIAACEKERLRSLWAELAKTYLRFGKWIKPKHPPGRDSSHHHAAPLLHDALVQLSKLNQVLGNSDPHEIMLVSDIANHVKRVAIELPLLLLGHPHGVDVNEIDNRGRSALFEAVESFSLPLVRLLLDHGANATIKDNRGLTPLVLARRNRLDDIASLLLQNGAIELPAAEKPSTIVPSTIAAPSTIDDILEKLHGKHGSRCDFDVLIQPGWKSFRNKYLRDWPRPALIRHGFRTWKKKKKKKKKYKKWKVPRGWQRKQLIKSKLSKTFVLTGSLPYSQITAPLSYQAEVPLRRFLKHNLGTSRMNVEEEEALVFDPNFFNTPNAKILLKPLRARRPYLKDPAFEGAVSVTQLSIGGKGSGAPAHWHETSFSMQISGNKLWAVYPPGLSMYSNLKSREWWKQNLFREKTGALICICKPGDVIYVPAAWSHFTLNLNQSYSVADSISASVVGYLSPLHLN